MREHYNSSQNRAKPSNLKSTPRSHISKTKENVNPSNPNHVSDSRDEKKSKLQSTFDSKKSPLSSSISSQLHPQPLGVHRSKPLSSSRDMFLELETLRTLLCESKEREARVQAKLREFRRFTVVVELEGELEKKRNEVDGLVKKMEFLEAEKNRLSEELVLLKSDSEEGVEEIVNFTGLPLQNLQLRRQNKKLQLQKRELACNLSSLKSQLATFEKCSESEIIRKIKDEAYILKQANEDLCKQVEVLQKGRLNEVEELAYLKWVNSCLRNELRMGSDNSPSPSSIAIAPESLSFLCRQNNDSFEFSTPKSLTITRKPKKWPMTGEQSPDSSTPRDILDKFWIESEGSPKRRHSLSGSKCGSEEDLGLSWRRQSDSFMYPKGKLTESEVLGSKQYDSGINKLSASSDVEKRPLRIPNPPPKPTRTVSSNPRIDEDLPKISPTPPPPPPPPPAKCRNVAGSVQRSPLVVEFYHSLMKRDSRRDSSNGVGGMYDFPDATSVRSNIIGEIENRSSHLLAIKADVETQGEFVKALMMEVNNAVYEDIEEVVAFVKWLDDELRFLVDERAVLKHFDWPEKRADTLREAAFSYQDLKKLETEVSFFEDDPRVSCEVALKKMITLSEKMERTVYSVLRSKEQLMLHCKEFRIPTDWMLDNGILNRIKFCSMKLAKKYMKRVAMELRGREASEKDPAMDYMLLQGVRFAFKIHQFAGGFDVETMHAFEELRNLASALHSK